MLSLTNIEDFAENRNLGEKGNFATRLDSVLNGDNWLTASLSLGNISSVKLFVFVDSTEQ